MRAFTGGNNRRPEPHHACVRRTDADAYLASVPRPSAWHGSGIPVAFFPVNARDSTCAGRPDGWRDSATGCNRDTEHAPEAADCTSLNGRRYVIPFRGIPPRLLHRFRSLSQPPRTVTPAVRASSVGVAFPRATGRCCGKEMRHCHTLHKNPLSKTWVVGGVHVGWDGAGVPHSRGSIAGGDERGRRSEDGMERVGEMNLTQRHRGTEEGRCGIGGGRKAWSGWRRTEVGAWTRAWNTMEQIGTFFRGIRAAKGWTEEGINNNE